MIIGALAWLKIGVEILEWVVPFLGKLGKKKAQKKVKQTEAVLDAVVTGVESYDKAMKAPADEAQPIKKTIQNIAIATGCENRLNAFIKRVKAKEKVLGKIGQGIETSDWLKNRVRE